MKKLTITFLATVLVMGGLSAQTVQEGVNDLYAERYKGAKATFEKLLAANPNNIEATYWLGQDYLAMKDVAAARDLYSKALMASANAPLIIVGMGQVELSEKKLTEATQRFETAITMTRGRKGDDPDILNAVGRAIVNTYTDKEKIGDINYAIEKLKAASERDANNPQIFLNLGNAYLKAKPGEGGGDAFTNFTKATAVNPNFAPPYHRLAKLFESQRNWELNEKYLNEAVTKDPRYAPAYYDLYYLKLGKLDFAAAQDMATKYIANSDPDPQADHFKAQTYWAEKKYDEAISISKSIITNAGASTKPRTYILIADSYLSKGDTAAAKPYIDEYFARAKPEDITSIHWQIRGHIYLGTPGQESEAVKSYIEAVNTDTVQSEKVDMLKNIAAILKGRKMYEQESQLQDLLLQVKPNPSLVDYFNTGLSHYFAGHYGPSRDIWLKVQEKFPAESYGFEWAFRASLAVDTVKKDSIAVPDALKLIEFSEKDSVKFKKQYLLAAGYLVGYYNNDAKDPVKALELVKKMIGMDPANETYLKIQQQLEKATRQSNPRSSNESRSGASMQGASKETRTGQ